ncbi:hypothetical protein [Actinomadura rugatobispora]|uniref:DNA-binding protein n=1 Tax=Actinomadura rugatobispora TaxID=1994 RepID=A0ABW0ZNG1_9ACTN|nr:hypothetical protein GCM10010200_036310 [Actinomadura rugatobispora]
MNAGGMNQDVLLTVSELATFFDGAVSYRAIDQWIRRGKLTPADHTDNGRPLIRLGDAQQVEAETHGAKRGRPRKTRPPRLYADQYL